MNTFGMAYGAADPMQSRFELSYLIDRTSRSVYALQLARRCPDDANARHVSTLRDSAAHLGCQSCYAESNGISTSGLESDKGDC